MDADFARIRQTVLAAELSDETRHTLTWCLERLPAFYQEFLQGYDARHGEEIGRLLKAILQALTEQGGNADVAAAVFEQLRSMHERLGIPGPDLKLPAVKSPRRRRKAG